MLASEPPFSEEILSYSVSDFPFAEHVCRFLLDDGHSELPLETLHQLPGFQAKKPRGNSQGERRLNMSPISDAGFREVYHRFLRDFVRLHLGSEVVLFEDSPNLRVHCPDAGRMVGPHIDADYGHSGCEINFWLPLTDSCDTATLWAESSPGRGDFHPFQTRNGQVVRFFGNQCLHFSRENLSGATRISFDFRVIRLCDFPMSGIPLAGDSDLARWTLFGFYSVMGPAGLVSRDCWSSVLAASASHSCTRSSPQIWTPALARQALASGSQRPRSLSPEHLQRCAQEFGSGRLARLQCARCSWIAVREQYRKALVYIDASGQELPWVSESPGPTSPWGLGCVLCHATCRSGLARDKSAVLPSAYSDFTFASGASGGLLMEALLRHGGNWEVCPGEAHAG